MLDDPALTRNHAPLSDGLCEQAECQLMSLSYVMVELSCSLNSVAPRGADASTSATLLWTILLICPGI